MNLDFDLDNDAEFEADLEKGVGGGYVKTDELEWVESGLYKCFIASAVLCHFNSGKSAIRCTFVALDNDGAEPVGKFSATYDVDPSEKFFSKTRELCYLTGNRKGLVETEMTNKDGEVVTDANGETVYKYDGLCSNEFQLIATVLKTGEGVGATGKTYGNYSVFNLFGTDKRSARELYLIEKKGADPDAVPPKDIGKAYAYLKQRMKQQEEADAALNGMAAKSAPKPAPAKAAPKPAARPAPAKPAARPAPKPQPAPEPEMAAEDDLPF